MSNVRHTTLLSLKKSLFNANEAFELDSTILLKSLIPNCKVSLQYLIRKPRPGFHFYHYRHYSTQDDQNKNDEGNQNHGGTSSNSNSSYYQQQTRNSYERKRSSYTKNHRTQYDTSTNDVNHYHRLNIDQDADSSAIKSAYYTLSKLYHPDIVGPSDKNAAENFRLVTESYEILSDPTQKANYDKELAIKSNQIDPSDFLNQNTNQDVKKDFNLMYRSRNAEIIFRSMQDAALMREKLKNPKKFRAGSFGTSMTEENMDKRIETLSRQLRRLNSSNRDAKNFYQMHLADTLQRRLDDLSTCQDNSLRDSMDYYRKKPEDLLLAIGLAIAGFVVLIILVFNLDPASFLDRKFVKVVNRKDSSESK